MLHDRNASVALYPSETRHLFFEHSSQNHTDDTLFVDLCGGSKERIDGRPEAILLRPMPKADAPGGFDQEMIVRWRQVDMSRFNSLLIFSVRKGEPAVLRQYFRKL